MTLFNKLAGKASALLNTSGICSNNCIKHVRWMKRYINRAPRHKGKRENMDYDD